MGSRAMTNMKARSARSLSEGVIHVFLFLCAAVSVLTTIGVIAILFGNASYFFSKSRIVSNDHATVVELDDTVSNGKIVTLEANGTRHEFDIHRFHRQDQRAQIMVNEGERVVPGQVLAVEPGVSLLEFFTEKKWTAQFNPPYFGILPLACGTALVAVFAGLFAIPVGLGTAIFLSEYAPSWVRRLVKPLLALLAGIPPVVYGYVAVVSISPFLKRNLQLDDMFSALSASIVVAIMILPMIVSLSEDALRAVPKSLREAAYALGATKFEVSTGVVVPAASPGILASCLLAISRATGETMAVALAAGLRPKLTLNPLDAVQTMTSYIVEVTKGDRPSGSLSYHAIFAVGLTLFLITMAMNLLAQFVLVRTRKGLE